MWSYWLKGDWVKLSFPEVAQATPDVASVGSGRTTGARRLPPDHDDHVLVIATFVDDRHDLRLRSLQSSTAACYVKDIVCNVIGGMIGGGSRLRIDSSLRMVASRLTNLVGSTRRRPAVHGSIPAKMGCK